MATFGSWLKEQKARSDSIGSLGKWWDANAIPKVHSLSGVERHIPAELKDALTEAANEHQHLRLAAMQAGTPGPRPVADPAATANSSQAQAYIAQPPPGFVSGQLPQPAAGAADAADLGLTDPGAGSVTAGSLSAAPEPAQGRDVPAGAPQGAYRDQLNRIERSMTILLVTMGLPVEAADQAEYIQRVQELGDRPDLAIATAELSPEAAETQRALSELMPATPEWWWLAASLADYGAETG
jgi:hypothetical protein